MALQIGSTADNTARWKSPMRLYTTEAGQIVEAGSAEASTLFMAEGAEIALKDAQTLGLTERYPQVNVVVEEALVVPRAELNAALEHWAKQASELQQELHEARQALSDVAGNLNEKDKDLVKAQKERDVAQAAAKRLEAENAALQTKLKSALATAEAQAPADPPV